MRQQKQHSRHHEPWYAYDPYPDDSEEEDDDYQAVEWDSFEPRRGERRLYLKPGRGLVSHVTGYTRQIHQIRRGDVLHVFNTTGLPEFKVRCTHEMIEDEEGKLYVLAVKK